jgi:ABC-type Zn uptake system ZnuABC Zn-binding protein ZnuA
MPGQERALANADLDPLFAEADAAVTIARVWREDPLYPAARARNIRIVPIDAARPWAENAQPVALRRRPCTDASFTAAAECPDEISPYVWLSISNGVRMAEHIATDLKRLAPDDADAIHANLIAFVDRLRDLKSEYDNRFAELPDPRIFALAEEFVYLFGEMGVFVDGHFLKEDVRWTEEDIAAFENYLSAGGAKVVVHKWEPAQPIRDAIARAGAKLVILDAADPGLAENGALAPDGYVTILRNDMDALLAALSE